MNTKIKPTSFAQFTTTSDRGAFTNMNVHEINFNHIINSIIHPIIYNREGGCWRGDIVGLVVTPQAIHIYTITGENIFNDDMNVTEFVFLGFDLGDNDIIIENIPNHIDSKDWDDWVSTLY